MMNKYSNGLSLVCLLVSVMLGACSESDTPVVVLDTTLDSATAPEEVVTETEEPATDTGGGAGDGSAARLPTVGFATEQLDVEAGAEFILNVSLENFPLSEGGGITVRFNQDVVRVIDVVIDGVWNFAASDGDIDNPHGVISDILVSSYQGVEGAAAVATLRMQAIAPGRSDIVLSESPINPFAAQGTKVGPEFGSAQVTVR